MGLQAGCAVEKGDDPQRELIKPARARRFDQKIHENRKDSTLRGNKHVSRSVTTRRKRRGPASSAR